MQPKANYPLSSAEPSMEGSEKARPKSSAVIHIIAQCIKFLQKHNFICTNNTRFTYIIFIINEIYKIFDSPQSALIVKNILVVLFEQR